MPAIIVKNYTWRQTGENVIIYAPLVGHPKTVDLFAIDNYLKASYPPFILELFLWGTILEEKSDCTLSEDQAIFSLKKAETGLDWPSLITENLDKDVKREYRTRALERARQLAEERAKTKSEKRQYLQSQAVRAQIDLDTSTLNKIDTIRDVHRREAMKELDDWRIKAEQPILNDLKGNLQENRKAYRKPIKWFKDASYPSKHQKDTKEDSESKLQNKHNSNGLKQLEWKNLNDDESCKKTDELSSKNISEGVVESPVNAELPQDPIQKECSSSSEDSESDYENTYRNPDQTGHLQEACETALKKFHERKKKENSAISRDAVVARILNRRLPKMDGIFDEPKKSVPLPRKNGTISVKFSDRVFPTPARESHHLEEQEWLEKQAEARRKTGFIAEDLAPEEQDPQWLKDKGDDFFKAGNYLGAISAYTHGIKLSEKMASLYVNRSAAHYALGNYYRCIQDCSTALELMMPQCSGNRESRARCHARRGAALCKLSQPQHGVPELEAALRLAPDNKSIERDLLAARQYFEMND